MKVATREQLSEFFRTVIHDKDTPGKAVFSPIFDLAFERGFAPKILAAIMAEFQAVGSAEPDPELQLAAIFAHAFCYGREYENAAMVKAIMADRSILDNPAPEGAAPGSAPATNRGECKRCGNVQEMTVCDRCWISAPWAERG